MTQSTCTTVRVQPLLCAASVQECFKRVDVVDNYFGITVGTVHEPHEPERGRGATSSSAHGKCEVCAAAGVLRCGKCHTARYCSARCQQTHWREHKVGCVAAATAAATAAAGGAAKP